MKTIIFENDGEIDLRAMSTFGCSVKESENPIGFFGTGLKYALAVLMRLRQSVTIQCGNVEYVIGVRKNTIRGKEFDFVVLIGSDQSETALGFTTELGKNWELWMAYRELHCNAKDEAGCNIFVSDNIPAASAGKTRVCVGGDDFAKSHAASSDFILTGTPLFKIGGIEVYSKPSQSFFYRGIKVMTLQKPALYTYNQTHRLELTEDRTAKDPHSVIYTIAREILAHGGRDMLDNVLVADSDHIEHHFDYHGWTNVEPGSDFFPAVTALQRSSLIKLNLTAVRLWREKGGNFIDPRRIRATDIQKKMLAKAIEFCEASGFMLRDEYPILIVETLREGGVMALADRHGKQIFLAENIFNQGGTKGVARALIEEYLHLKYGLEDCTREMQNWIFDKMVSLAEQIQGEPI